MKELDVRQEAEMPAADPDPGASRSEEDARADLGVLLVHGIGQSRSGETLTRFGEPLAKWIVDWVGTAAGAEVEAVDAVLGVEAEDPREPARTRLRVSAPAVDGSGQRAAEWLIAESWWAESFVTPSFAELANWGFNAVPWTVLYHFHRRFARAASAWGTAWRARPRRMPPVCGRTGNLVLELLWLLLALLFAPLLVGALALLLVLGLIPIPRLRRFVAWLQRGLALTLGDSYALLGPIIGSAAIYGRVRRDLEWLARRSKQVAVVAHSQGAAVAYRVVSRDRTGRCRLLVTFGAGLRKLGQIRLLEKVPSGWVWLVSLALITLVVAALISRATLGIWRGLLLAVLVPAIWFGSAFLLGLVIGLARRLLRRRGRVHPGGRWQRFAGLIGLLMIVVTTAAIAAWLPGPSRATTVWVTLLVSFSWSWLILAFRQAEAQVQRIVMTLPEAGRLTPFSEQPLPDSVRWLDLYAASDPVPNGPIFDGQSIDPLLLVGQAAGLESCEVLNRGSLLTDHTTYWKNPEGFVASVVAALGELCGLKLEEVLPLDRKRLIVARHRRKWRVGWLRRARLAVVATALAVWWLGSTETLAARLFQGLLDGVRGLPWLGSLLGWALPAQVSPTPLTEALAVALGAAAVFGLVKVTWLVWESKDRAALVGRRGYAGSNDFPHPALHFHFVVMASLAAGMVLILGWTSWPWWAYLAGLLGLYLLAGAVAGAGGFQGEVSSTWPELLKRLGSWSDETQREWARAYRRGAIGLIDPIAGEGGRTVWQAGVTLVWHPASHALTKWHATAGTETLAEAVAWTRDRVDRVFASAGDRRYLPAAQLLEGAFEPEPAERFWSSMLDRPGISPAQRAEAQLHRGVRQAESGRTDEAIAHFTAVIEADAASAHDRAMAYTRRGHVYRDLDQVDAAIADYSAALEVPEAPPDELAQALANRGWLAYGRADLSAFLTDSREAAEHDPEHAVIAFNLAFAELLNGHEAEARERYRTLATRCADPGAIGAAVEDLGRALERPSPPAAAAEILTLLQTRLAELSSPGPEA